MKKIYQTNQVAKLIGVHPNTVRLYEKLGLITKADRLDNGYRTFTQLQLDQFQLARTAFQIEILQNGLRKKVVEIVKLSASCEFEQAMEETKNYISLLQKERDQAKEAVNLVEVLFKEQGNLDSKQEEMPPLRRKEVSNQLGISMDTLRNWEMNGLLRVKRKENGYRVYTQEDIIIIKIIRSLKCANYSLSSILRMLQVPRGRFSRPQMYQENRPPGLTQLEAFLNQDQEEENILTACDKLNISLINAQNNAWEMLSLLQTMNEKYKL